jgi:hypothetical protein
LVPSRAWLLAMASLLPALASATPHRSEESRTSLGHGYSVVMKAEEVRGGFESIAHYRYCFHRRQNLGQCERMFVSPSGRFALFQLGPGGGLMQFDVKSRRTAVVAATPQGLVRAATWDEPARQVTYTLGQPVAGPRVYHYHY